MKDREQIRKEILEIPIGDIISSFRDSLMLADKCGDICATIRFANQINTLEDIVDLFVSIDEETDNLLTEG